MNTTPHFQTDFRATTNKKNATKPNRGLSPARGLARVDQENCFFELIGSFSIFQTTTGTAARVQSLGGGARVLAAVVMLLAFLPCRAQAITGTVTYIDIPCATDDELAETILPLGRMVQRSSDPKDVRIGNGYSLGGISLWNFEALTNPPTSFPHDISMDHHHVRLDVSYSLNAEAGRLTAWYGTNAIWTVLASSSLASNVILSVEAEGTNMAFTVASESDNVTVEATASLVDPVWEEVDFGFERLSLQTVKLTVANPPVGEMQYVRVQTEIGNVGMVLSIPLSVPSMTVGGAAVTAAAISNWTAAHAWGNHGAAGYATGTPVYVESDPVASAALSHYLSLTGGVINGSINMGGNAVTNVSHIFAEDGMDLHPGSSYGVLHGEWRVDSISVGDGSVISNWSKFLSLSNNAGINELDLVGGTSQPTRILVGGNDSIQFGDDKVFYNGFDLWDASNGANTWNGRIVNTESARIRTDSSPVAASGTVTIAANTTNRFIRPDGMTNSVAFDADGTMRLYFPNTTNVVMIRTNGSVRAHGFGVGRDPGTVYLVDVAGDGRFTSIIGTAFKSSSDNTFAVNPYSSSKLKALVLTETLVVTQGVSQIIIPTSATGLAPGTLWNDGGTVKVAP